MADIRRYTRREADIVETKIGHERVKLKQKRERLPNASAGTKDSNVGKRAERASSGSDSVACLDYCLQKLTNTTTDRSL